MAVKSGRLKQSDLPNSDEPDDDDPVINDGGVDIDVEALDREAREAEERGTKKGGDDRSQNERDRTALQRADDDVETDEERRTRRREERASKKEEERKRDEARNRELSDLRETVGLLQKKMGAADGENVRETIGRIESEMRERQQQYETARELKEKAFRDKDNPDAAKAAVEADEAMTAARERYNELGGARQQLAAQAEQEARRPKISPELAAAAKSFVDDHEWYDKSGKDRDSARVIAIDRKMAAEGWNPNTGGYWEELRERVKEQLPHRFKGGKLVIDDGPGEDREERRPPRSRTGGSGREAGGGGGETFHLSKARVDALKEAGMWDDPVQRNKMIRKYRDQDAAARRDQQRRGS